MQFKPFLAHTSGKQKQSAHFEALVKNSDSEHVVLQVDFSENATIASQREIQYAHWTHSQATVFTAHAWLGNENKKGTGIVSDDLNHEKCSAFIHAIYFEISQNQKCHFCVKHKTKSS